MEELMKLVELFHEKFGIPVGDKGECKEEHRVLHYDLLIEEVLEFRDASESDDIVGIADALGDVMFVLLSSAIEHGLHKDGVFDKVFREICRSNLTKRKEGDDAVRRADGKVMKGDGYEKPDLVSILKEYKFIK